MRVGGLVLRINHQMQLIEPFTEDDVKQVMFKIDNTKSPGPDGYGSGFFKEAWGIVGGDITTVVLEFFQTGHLLKQVNATNIILIPKVEAPEQASQFRTIACCNVIYKCISKTICTRLKGALNHLVADNQPAFVQGRSMIHNILICHDLLRHYNRKTTPRCLMKIDLKKAYDMVSWEFLEEALEGYGFPQKIHQMDHDMGVNSQITVKINGEGYGYFEGKRGLRQGDPVSPLLFVLVMEYLSRLLKSMLYLPDFRFHPMCKDIRLNHLVFARRLNDIL